jgi:branched-chain amino acid transport system permease protein
MITGVLLLVMFAFFRYTRLGLAMKAAAENPVSARLVGIRVGRMQALGWGLATAVGSIAGMLIAPIVFLEPNMMAGTVLYGFAGAVLGGLASPGGAVLGGLIVGVLENLSGTFIPVIGGELKLPIALLIIVAVLVVKPQGLLGRASTQRV